MKMAAGAWTPIQNRPEPGRSYLICATYGGVQTCDVAFYNGTRADGSHRWTLGMANGTAVRFLMPSHAAQINSILHDGLFGG
ncbi:hypothetical protein [Mesorhizobium sp. 43Arga]